MGFFEASQLTGTGRLLQQLPQCGKCGLFKNCQSPKMPPTGRGERRILFVGEAPGETEDERNEQLVGKAGQCLRRMLATIKVDLDDCVKSNAVICRPEHNEIDDLFIDCCRPNLINTIAKYKPNVIIMLGMSAVKSLIGVEFGGDINPMQKWTGWRIPSQRFGAWLCPTYHPSYVLREKEDPVLVKITTEHLRAACRLETKPLPYAGLQERLSGALSLYPTPAALREQLVALRGWEGLCAFDYETTSLKPEGPNAEIFCVSFHSKDFSFAGRVDETCFEPLSEILKNPKVLKIGANNRFEDRWTRRILGHPVASWHWDTMLGAHVLDNRSGITSLKFQAYTTFGIGDYNSSIKPFLEGKTPNSRNTIHLAPLNDVLLYNGTDSALEFEIAMLQMEMFNE